jgi:ABC-type sugar transport system ATPase subunit
MTSLTLANVRKRYGSVDIIHGIDLTIESGEFTVFVGPSGCGKSTLLRMISGLEDITSGEPYIGERRMNDVQAARRGVAMVFQSYALYPHLDVRRNLGFGLKVRKVPTDELNRRVEAAAATLKLDGLLDRYPRELSGGQRQRVAIGRAIVGEPEVFLFDEPLSNLDAELRVHMRSEIAALHKRLGNTMVYVTHDQIEAMTLADRIVVLRAGLVEQVGTPRELYERPGNLFVAQFIGSPRMNVLPIDRVSAVLSPPAAARHVGMRPEDMRLTSPEAGLVAGRITISEYTGATSMLHVALDDGSPVLVIDDGTERQPDERVGLTVGSEKLHFFDDAGNRVPSAAA